MATVWEEVIDKDVSPDLSVAGRTDAKRKAKEKLDWVSVVRVHCDPMKLKVQAKPERSEVFDCPTWEDAVQEMKTWLAANQVSAAEFISASVYDDAATHILGKITFEGDVMYTVKAKRYRPIK